MHDWGEWFQILAQESISQYNSYYTVLTEEPMVRLKLTQVGSSTGLVLPKEVLSRLKLVKGDALYLTESPDGFRITPYDPEFEEDMAIARKVMRDNRDALRELAK